MVSPSHIPLLPFRIAVFLFSEGCYGFASHKRLKVERDLEYTETRMNAFTMGFITGCIVTVCIFLLVFGLVFWLRRRRSKGLTISSDNYARVLDSNRGGIELVQPPPPPSSSFVIGEDEREDMTHLELQSNPELTPQEFESSWLSFQARQNLNFTLTFGDANIEEILSSQRIKCMACGEAGARQKYYFFGRERQTNSAFLMEVFVLAKEREMAAEIRCASSVLLPDLVAYVRQAMKPFSKAAM